MENHNNTLTMAQQKSAAKVLAAAFAQDIFMAYLFPDPVARENNLAKLFQPVVRCSLLYGGVQLASNNNGALAWMPGTQLPLNLSQLFHSGLIWAPLTIGMSAFKRLQDHDGFCEHVLLSKAPQGFAYLWIVGVHPKAKGQGLGKRMIQAALNDMHSHGYGTCLLRTDNENNVPLYQHLGFELIYTGTAPKSGLQYWLLSQSTAPAN
ncbi:MAG: N-acetyltransferase [Cyanobacteria bacterium P01_H01_bin.21]